MPVRTTSTRTGVAKRRGTSTALVLAGALLAAFHARGGTARAATAHGTAAFEAALHVWVRDDAAITSRAYARALDGTERLRTAVARFLDAPSDSTLRSARDAWRASRQVYGPTEVFRFSDGPIDGDNGLAGREGPENRINAWPMDEAYLDSVAGSPRGGLIPQLSLPLDRGTLEHAHGSRDDSEVTLGFHAIEFLLWGQDRDTVAAGRRSFRDFLAGDPVRERRRACLSILADLLVEDLGAVAREWGPGPSASRYAARFVKLPPLEALRRALSGAATLSGFELASERIGVPLATSSPEDEQSCFSDNTVRDFAANIEGLALVLEGDGESPGMLEPLEALDPRLAGGLRERLDEVRRRMLDIPEPFDAVILSQTQDPRRQRYQALAGELIGLSGALRHAGERAGVMVTIGGGG
jgi:putative iron-regulated protein